MPGSQGFKCEVGQFGLGELREAIVRAVVETLPEGFPRFIESEINIRRKFKAFTVVGEMHELVEDEVANLRRSRRKPAYWALT